MQKVFSLQGIVLVLTVIALILVSSTDVFAANSKKIDNGARDALQELYQTSSEAKRLSEDAVGILVFPKMVKGGFIFGAQLGTGALFKKDEVVAYYQSSSVSYGLQIGIKQFGYAVFFMSDEDLGYLDRSDGWEIGSAPSLVIVDSSASGKLSTTSAKEGIYSFFFGSKGLMAGLSLEGTKITKYNPGK